jgi:hypothetical protein
MRAKLPVFSQVGAAWRDVLANLPGLARIAWPYYALALALSLLVMAGHAGDAEGGLAGLIAPALGEGTAAIVLSLCTLACTVRWQRHVVLGEPLRGIAPLNLRVLRYAFWGFVVGLVAVLPVAAAALAGYAMGAIALEPEATIPLAVDVIGIGLLVLGAAASIVVVMRLGPVTVAVSADDRATGFRRAWEATRGNGLRLLGVMLLLVLSFGALGFLLGLAIGAANLPTEPGIAAAVERTAGSLVELVSGVVIASVTARVYRTLVAGEPALTPEAA